MSYDFALKRCDAYRKRPSLAETLQLLNLFSPSMYGSNPINDMFHTMARQFGADFDGDLIKMLVDERLAPDDVEIFKIRDRKSSPYQTDRLSCQEYLEHQLPLKPESDKEWALAATAYNRYHRDTNGPDQVCVLNENASLAYREAMEEAIACIRRMTC